MRLDVSATPLLAANPPNSDAPDGLASPCRCGCASAHAPAVAPPGPGGRFKHSGSGGALTLLGVLGWLCVPKCPLCLAACVAIGSGVSISLAQGQALRQLLFASAALMIAAGAWRLAISGRRFYRLRLPRRSVDVRSA
jgi:hypothetical protein